MDDRVWAPTLFTKNRGRLMRHDVDEQFLAAINKQAYARKLLFRDHFSIDGTLLDACASLKSFKLKLPSADDFLAPGGKSRLQSLRRVQQHCDGIRADDKRNRRDTTRPTAENNLTREFPILDIGGGLGAFVRRPRRTCGQPPA